MHESQQHPLTPLAQAPLHVIGLGASAGGLEPLIEFLHAFPLGHGFALIVVQHLAHAHKSALADLLRLQAPMPVLEAADGLKIEADHAYVITAATELTVTDGLLRVSPAGTRSLPAHEIDELFRSLALAYGPRAIGVVLSGMGSDGSDGLRAIVNMGGHGIAQAPESAQFDSMPRNAAAVGRSVLIATPSQMPHKIIVAIAAQSLNGQQAEAPQDAGDALAMTVRRVAAVTGHDFSQYKPSTLRRRIERRMAIHASASMGDYVRLLAASDQEAALLFNELLIGVTGFFRDPLMWEVVQQSVMPALLSQAASRPEHKLRAWVVGCSTGEEAYTLAMLLREALDAVPGGPAGTAQIFATDLNADAIQIARRGVYPASIAASMSAARLARFFVPESGGYRVTKPLREMVLFARHDAITDAPFTRLDLVSCRNLLIYFKAALQQRILPLFQYLLVPGGHLLLGNSEALGRFESLFTPVDAKLRVYRRSEAPLVDATVYFPTRTVAMLRSTSENSPMITDSLRPRASLQSLADRLMLEEFSPPAVLVTDDGDILYVSGHTGRFLEPAAGKANWNVHAMAREGLRAPLTKALRHAGQEGQAVELRGLTVDAGGAAVGVDITVRPVKLASHGGLILVLFRETHAVPVAAPIGPAGRSRRSARDTELTRALDEVQALREEMQSSQEELVSANEELQSANEELQSANEELTSSKEEMQAMNEELQTVNAELMSKLDDLALAQSDLKNLLNSTQIATLFLDSAMNVRRFTEQAKRVINLRDSDVGRPLSDLTTTLDYPALVDDIGQVQRTLEYCEKAVRTTDARWYSIRVMPYRTQDNVIEGSVITFVDITAAKELEARLRAGGEPGQP